MYSSATKTPIRKVFDMMNRDLAKQIRKEMMDAAKAIAAKHGYEVKSGSGTFDPSGDEYKINNVTFFKEGEVTSKFSNAAEQKMERDWIVKRNSYGLSHINVGDDYFDPTKNQRMELVGWKSANRKYPVLVKAEDGTLYKMTAGAFRLEIGQ